MSRTFRRTQPHLIKHYVGSFEEFVKDPWINNKYHGCTLEQQYQRRLHRFMRDRKSGIWGTPRW